MTSATAKDQIAQSTIKTSVVPALSPENMIAYKEKPASNKYSVLSTPQISAENLFSLFTAEVIEKNTEFSR